MSYIWKDLIPLTARNAARAMKKEVPVFVLTRGKKKQLDSAVEIAKYAAKGFTFAANRECLERAETTFDAEYTIVLSDEWPAEKPDPAIQKHYDSSYNLHDTCMMDIQELVSRENLPDGDYFVEQYVYKICMGEKSCWSVDEGNITVKNGSVVQFPESFTLPF